MIPPDDLDAIPDAAIFAEAKRRPSCDCETCRRLSNPLSLGQYLKAIPDAAIFAEAKRRRGNGACVCGYVSEQTSRASRSRKTFARQGGRPKRLSKCATCGRMLGVVEMRKHRH